MPWLFQNRGMSPGLYGYIAVLFGRPAFLLGLQGFKGGNNPGAGVPGADNRVDIAHPGGHVRIIKQIPIFGCFLFLLSSVSHEYQIPEDSLLVL